MSAARIAPVDPPYSPDVQAAFDVVMRGAPPLKLFRTMAHNPRALARLMAGGLLDRGSITLRQRELMILRTTALCDAGYEWGVHVAAFAAKAGIAQAEWEATATGADPDSWSIEDRLVLRLAERLYETHDVDDALWAQLVERFDAAQLVELIMLAGQYHGVSFLVKALRVEDEAQAPRLHSAVAA